MGEFVLCIDGGGSKTAAAICDQTGQIIRHTTGPGCNPLDNANWAQNLSKVVGETLCHEGVKIQPAFSVIGMPGYSEVPAAEGQVRDLIRTLLGQNTLIMNDVELACRAAFPNGDGVLLLAGTGAMAMMIIGDQVHRAGGWGELIGDEGSAYWIGQHTLAHLARAADGRGEYDAFTDAMAGLLQVDLGNGGLGLIAWLHRYDHLRSRIAGLAAIVDQLAIAGNTTAQAFLKDAAAELAMHAQAVQRQNMAPFRWAFAGSVFKSNTFRAEVIRILKCPPSPAVYATVPGGLWQAAKAAGWLTATEFSENLHAYTYE